jgi:hypothetical protein
MKNQHATKKGAGRVHKSGFKKTEAKHSRSQWSYEAYQHARGQI